MINIFRDMAKIMIGGAASMLLLAFSMMYYGDVTASLKVVFGTAAYFAAFSVVMLVGSYIRKEKVTEA